VFRVFAAVRTSGDEPLVDAPAGRPADFCARFCGKCAGCWGVAGFSEGDCLYQLAKPNFSLDDCLAGCSVGRTRRVSAFEPGSGWEALTCAAFDEGM
jgi:hypothetical protein